MLHLINNWVSLLGRVRAVEDFCIFYSFKEFFFVLLCITSFFCWLLLFLKIKDRDVDWRRSMSSMFVTPKLSNQSAPPNRNSSDTLRSLHPYSQQRQNNKKYFFFVFFTSRVTWVCYEMETYSPCLWSVWMSLCDIPVRLCSHHRAADISMIPFCTPFASGSAIVLKLNVKEKNNEKNTHSLTHSYAAWVTLFFWVCYKVRWNERLAGRKQKGDKRSVFLFFLFSFFPTPYGSKF